MTILTLSRSNTETIRTGKLPLFGAFSVYQPLKLNDSSTTGPKLRDCWNFWNCRVSRIARALGCWVLVLRDFRSLGFWVVRSLGPSGSLGFWVSGPLGFWVSGSLGPWVFGSLSLWVSGSLGLWVSGSLGLWVSGSLGLWVFGSLGLWVFGFLGLWASLFCPIPTGNCW